MSIRARLRVALSLAVAGGLLTGCSGSGTSVGALRSSPTPELRNLTDTGDDIANTLALNTDLNLRMISEDAARALLLDRPSRLSPAPIPR
jgi:hypothetical protein